MSDRRPLMDLDDAKTWPAKVSVRLRESLSGLAREREAARAWSLYRGPRPKPEPPETPITDQVVEEITLLMEDADMRVFHATRLLDPEEVRSSGLRPLSIEERISRLKELRAAGQLAGGDDLDACIADVDLTDNSWSSRPGKVWATPLRRPLHDGGCDVFFEHWGGEFVQRLSGSSPALRDGIRRLGSPFVVVIGAPILGWCTRARSYLAPTMIDLALEASGFDVRGRGWDVLGTKPVPPNWIEAVVPPNDPLVGV